VKLCNCLQLPAHFSIGDRNTTEQNEYRCTETADTLGDEIRIGNLNVQTAERNVRFEVSTAVTMKNVVFWDIKTQFVPHRRHIMSPLQSTAG
jgi:hypothetical protein